jgi:two-component system, NtrC family, nitrogen regulation response regulator GlnG
LPPEVLGAASADMPVASPNTINSVAPRADSMPATHGFSSEKSASMAADYAPEQAISPAHNTAPATIMRPATSPAAAPNGNWESGLELEALQLLAKEEGTTWDELTRRFERRLIQAALSTTRGRRIEAAVKLGIGRNTITRKIQELGLE